MGGALLENTDQHGEVEGQEKPQASYALTPTTGLPLASMLVPAAQACSHATTPNRATSVAQSRLTVPYVLVQAGSSTHGVPAAAHAAAPVASKALSAGEGAQEAQCGAYLLLHNPKDRTRKGARR